MSYLSQFQCIRPQVRVRKFFLVDACKIRPSLYFPLWISFFSFCLAICPSSPTESQNLKTKFLFQLDLGTEHQNGEG